jgi:hypothetical protein
MRSVGQTVIEAQIDKYCTCLGEKLTELNEDALAGLKQRVEALGYECL